MSTDAAPAAAVDLERPPSSAPAARRPVPEPARTPPAAPATPAPAMAAGGREHWVVPLAVLIVGMFMSVLDTSIVNVAISAIQTDFGGSTADVAWISTAYSLVLGVVVPASAWLGDRIGLGRVYMWSLVAFSAGSALCGLAWNLDSLIAFRVVQAIPGGLLPAVCLTMVYRLVPPAKIGAAMGMYGLGIIVAPAIGPALGGYLVEYVNWRLVFYINVPVGILGLIAAVIWLPKFAQAPTRRFDVAGFLTIATGLVSLLLAFSEGPSWGWTGYRVLGLIALSVLSLAAFVVIELEVEHPLLNLRVFTNRLYTTSLLAMSVMMTGLFATLFYIPLFLQEGLGYPALRAGFLLLPQALVMAVLMPVAGRLYDTIGPRYLAFGGLLIAATGTFLLTGINPDMTRGELVFWLCVRAAGTGLAMMPIMTGGLSALPGDLTTSGSAINTVAQRVSAALGLAGLTAVVTNQQGGLMAARAALVPAGRMPPGEVLAVYQRTQLDVLAASYSNVFLLTGVLTLVAAALSLMLRTGSNPHAGGPGAAMME
ncbi:DHA2 family efflux MFS transporter permease subunit [Microlunatus sagamiharensis]|nr:DHA2 family efflux MFS transporter permease subunit [Microlunatus sagamiharensis]